MGWGFCVLMQHTRGGREAVGTSTEPHPLTCHGCTHRFVHLHTQPCTLSELERPAPGSGDGRWISGQNHSRAVVWVVMGQPESYGTIFHFKGKSEDVASMGS